MKQANIAGDVRARLGGYRGHGVRGLHEQEESVKTHPRERASEPVGRNEITILKEEPL